MVKVNPGIKTTEFWAALGVAVAKAILPELPDEAIYAVIAYILSRTTVKAANIVWSE